MQRSMLLLLLTHLAGVILLISFSCRMLSDKDIKQSGVLILTVLHYISPLT
jgi:hypothetical protein